MSQQREFRFTDRDFRQIQRLVRERTGIALSDGKRDMVYARLARRLRALGLESFRRYCALLVDESSGELPHCINAITTNLTAFFREAHQFDYLADQLLPRLLRERAAARRLRFWSAACATGEEAYSLAMVLRERMSELRGWDVAILATDIDTDALALAARGVYPLERLGGVSEERLRRFFLAGSGEHAGQVKVSEELRALVCFRELNLLASWPMRGPFDVVLCRNVTIYFGPGTQRALFERLHGVLAEDGHLFVGHAENLCGFRDCFESVGGAIYRRQPLPAAGSRSGADRRA